MNGVKPEPRAKHVAVALGPDHMLVYGGINHKTRYGDAFILSLKENVWYPAHFEGDVTPGKRSKSSACVHEGKVYLFGGYGGSGRAMADLWEMALPSGDPTKAPLKWEEIEPQGKPPAPRFSHRLAGEQLLAPSLPRNSSPRPPAVTRPCRIWPLIVDATLPRPVSQRSRTRMA